jgi:hypothetical protein
MAGSLFSPQQITFTQKDFDFTFFHTQPLYVEAFVDHYQIKRILIESGAFEYSQAVEFGPFLLCSSLQLFVHMTGPLEPRKV